MPRHPLTNKKKKILNIKKYAKDKKILSIGNYI